MGRHVTEWTGAVKATLSHRADWTEKVIQDCRRKRGTTYLICGDTILVGIYRGDGRVEVYDAEIRQLTDVE